MKFEDWLAEWFEETLTWAAFEQMSDADLAERLMLDLTEAGWMVSRA